MVWEAELGRFLREKLDGWMVPPAGGADQRLGLQGFSS
jgi:hypothetical protein